MAPRPPRPPFGLYIHWPFCQSKCPYCDFNSHVRDVIDQGAWRDAYLAELDRYAGETSDRVVSSVFFGGGTPSLMPVDTMTAIIRRIGDNWTLAEGIEITAEANPSSAEIKVFQGFRDAGINRLSLGVQSFDDRQLVALGRLHSAGEAIKAIAASQTIFQRTSFDLIYARPGQTAGAWRQELARALDLAVGHLSLYQLTIEPGTDFHRLRVPAAEEGLAEQLFDITQEMTEIGGLPGYEISNHARAGEECRHNLVYWRGDDYVGVGPGAHGRLSKNYQTETIQEFRAPEAWLDKVNSLGSATQKRHSLSFDERRDEILLMGLRLQEGVSALRFKAQTGRELYDSLPAENLQALENMNFLKKDGDYLRATPAGRLRLNAVLGKLLA